MSDVNSESLERMYFLLFPTPKEDSFKRLLLLAAFQTIKELQRTTLYKLQCILSDRYSYSNEDVRIAVSVLSNPVMFNCVQRYNVPKKRDDAFEVIQLTVKSNTNLIDNWVTEVLEANPEFSNCLKVLTVA